MAKMTKKDMRIAVQGGLDPWDDMRFSLTGKTGNDGERLVCISLFRTITGYGRKMYTIEIREPFLSELPPHERLQLITGLVAGAVRKAKEEVRAWHQRRSERQAESRAKGDKSTM